jgi:microcystin-dependent protein
MAGYWSQSRSQIHDLNGRPLIGAKALFTKGGTTTPITVYQDSGLTTPLSNPVVSDGQGFFPATFLDEADGFFNVAVSTAQGVALYTDISIPIIGPTGGGGGGGGTPVDPNALLQTGDCVIRYGAEFRAGLVRLNGRSIGSATSGATERANSDTQNLYSYLWNIDPNIVISGGRGGNAASDFAANKPLVLPDYRSRALVGNDAMGNTAAGIIASFNALGAIIGEVNHILTIAEMPSHAHGLSDPGHVHNWGNTARAQSLGAGNVGSFSQGGALPGELNTTLSYTGITMSPTGGGGAHNNLQPSKVISIYMKL